MRIKKHVYSILHRIQGYTDSQLSDVTNNPNVRLHSLQYSMQEKILTPFSAIYTGRPTGGLHACTASTLQNGQDGEPFLFTHNLYLITLNFRMGFYRLARLLSHFSLPS